MARFDNLGKAIGIAISKDESGIRKLLQRNGVSTANIKTKLQLSDVFVESMMASRGMAKDFESYIKSKSVANASGYYNINAFNNLVGDAVPDVANASGYYNIDAFNNLVGDAVPDAYNMSGSNMSDNFVNSDGENEEEKEKGGFFAGLNLADLLQSAKEVYLADVNADTVSNETEQIKLASQTQILNPELNSQPVNIPAKSSSNTGLYIGLGVLGLAVVLGAVYVFSRKK
jgi:hypothetical protein